MQRHAPVTAALIAASSLAAAALGQPLFTGIGFLPGGTLASTSFADAVSPDGSVVAGRGNRVPVTPWSESARWTRAGGIQGMGLPSGIGFSTSTGVSLGGTFICGYHESFAEVYRAYRWHSSVGAYQDLGAAPGGFANSFAQGISRDGKVVVGFGRTGIAGSGLGFIWRDGVGMMSMGDLPGGVVNSVALGVSGDGQVVVGGSDDAAGARPVMWRDGAGLTVLPDLAGGNVDGFGIDASNDGRFIVGYSNSTLGVEAVLWRDYGTAVVGLGDLPGGQAYSIALGVTDTASMIVGYSSAAAGERGFIWTPSRGTRDAKAVLQADYGLNLAGWTIGRVNSISADGTVLTGDGEHNGRFEGWVAVIPSPATAAVLSAAAPMIARRRR